VSFFKNLESMAQGMGSTQPEAELPPHSCAGCQTQMEYRGPHTIRTGGLQRGFGVGADLLLGSGLDNLLNQATERNVLVHVMVCPNCGEVALINDPQRGF
jgi:DNA polymerase III alpha subunit (gram-positive type)